MKKLVFASAVALAGVCLVSTPTLRAEDPGQSGSVQLPPDQYNAYQNFSTQTDPTQKCATGESFLTSYPQSQVKKAVLDGLIDCYNALGQLDKVKGAATRLLQIDPNYFKAYFAIVFVEKIQCGKSVNSGTGVSSDPQTCDDSATMAQKGLTVPKPGDMSDSDWKNLTASAYPIFHSAIAFDDMVSKKDYKGAEDEFTKELMLMPAAATQSGQGLIDTLYLAQVYSKPGDARDEVKAVWFYARAYDYAPGGAKPQIEQSLDYWYDTYHGMLDGQAAITQQIGQIKTQAQSTVFPPADFKIAPAPSPEELANKYCAVGPDDLKKMALGDKEFILANAGKECTDRLWAVMQGQQTPVPGVVVSAPAAAMKISVTTAASPKPKDYVVKLTNPVACNAVPMPPSELRIKEAQAYILANGVKADTDAMGDDLTETPVHLRKILIEPGVTVFNVAVTEDAKASHIADFTVIMKDPASCKDAPATGWVGFELKIQPSTELDGTYDHYTKVAAQGSTAASAQIVLTDGFLQLEKKAAPVHHPVKPSPGHHAGM